MTDPVDVKDYDDTSLEPETGMASQSRDRSLQEPLPARAPKPKSPASMDRKGSFPWPTLIVLLIANAVLTSIVFASFKYGGSFWLQHWDDVGNLVGIAVSLAGFYWTIRVATSAERAAKEARDNVFRFDAVVELSQALALMGDIQNFHREHQWKMLPDRYRRVREKLVSVRSPSSTLHDDQRGRITGVIEQLKDIDEKIESCLLSSKSEPSPPKPLVLLGLVKSQTDVVSEILAELRQRKP